MMDIAIDKVREMIEFSTCPPKTKVIYHTGFLCKDRERARKYGEVLKRADTVNSVAYMAQELSDAGRAYLTQRRLGDEVYEYIATRSSRK